MTMHIPDGSDGSGDARSTSPSNTNARRLRLFEMQVQAEMLRRDLEASGIGYDVLSRARLHFYRHEDDTPLTEVMRRLEAYRRRHLN